MSGITIPFTDAEGRESQFQMHLNQFEDEPPNVGMVTRLKNGGSGQAIFCTDANALLQIAMAILDYRAQLLDLIDNKERE